MKKGGCDADWDGHNPYFNRWFSAIEQLNRSKSKHRSHNPYFNRWFSAIITDQQ